MLTISVAGANVSIYADASASDTAGGADSITLGAVTSATVYGAAGADTLLIGAALATGGSSALYADLGADAGTFTGAGDISASTLIGGAANDTFMFGSNVTSSSIVGGGGNDTFEVKGTIDTSISWVVMVLTPLSSSLTSALVTSTVVLVSTDQCIWSCGYPQPWWCRS